MAGLGESCSHVGAMLFYIEAAVRVRDSKTDTKITELGDFYEKLIECGTV